MMLPVEILLAKGSGNVTVLDGGTYSTYEGRSGTLDKTVDAPAFVEDWPVNFLKFVINGEMNNFPSTTGSLKGISWSIDEATGSMTFSGTPTEYNWFRNINCIPGTRLENGVYHLSGGTPNVGLRMYGLREDETAVNYGEDFGEGLTFEVTDEVATVYARIQIDSKDVLIPTTTIYPMLVKDSKSRGFIPYGGGEVKTTDGNGNETILFLAPDTPKPVAGLKTFGGVTNIVSDFDVKLIYAKRQDKYMEALLMNNMEIAPNAGAHNSVYRGKFLGNSVTEAQYAAIRSGRFDDLFVGDYWTIGGVNYRIAHFDYYLNSSDPPTTEHHAVLVPDTTMGECQFMNTQSGEYIAGTYNNMPNGYLGSGIYSGKLYDNTTDNAFAVAKNTIKAVFGEHILPHKLSFSSAVSGGKVSNTESAMSEIELMTERMVYGSVMFSPVSDGNNIPKYYEIEKTQLALFALDPSRIVSDRSWWLRDILSTTHVADVYQSGGADYSNSTNVYGVRPSFCIKG